MAASVDTLKPVYYFYGSEGYAMEEALAEIKARALAPGLESMNLHVYDARGIDAAAAVTAAGTLPAFSDRRVVVVRDAGSLKKEAEEAFVAYVASPSPSTCLIFLDDDPKPSGELFKALSRSGVARAFNHLREEDAAAWIRREAARQGKSISSQAAYRLLSITGRDLRLIKGELDKIILYAGDKKEIDGADVEGAGVDLKEESIYALSDAIGARDVKKALKTYSRLSGEPPLKVMSAIAYQMRALLKLKAALKAGVSGAGLASETGIKHWKMDASVRMAGLFSESELKAALMRLAREDVRLKSGAAPPGLGLSNLIIDLCARKAR